MKKLAVSIVLVALIVSSLFSSGVFSPQTSSAQNASEQAQIQALLVLIGQLQQQLSNLLAQQNSACTILTQNLYIGLYDYGTGGQVTKLQKFLKAQGDFTHPSITGFYGAATQQAVQSFQSRMGILSGGTPGSNGYGVVGPTTRAKIQTLSCGGAAPTVPVTPPVPAVIPGGATVSCTPSTTSIIQGGSVTWSATVTGGTPPYTLSWSGTNSLSGFAPTVTKTYNSTGVKTAALAVNGSAPVACSGSVTVSENPALNYNISCTPNVESIPVGGSVTWTASVSGGTPPYTYSWHGSDGLSGSGGAVTKTYNSAGLKEASLEINGVDEADCSSEVQVGAVVVPGQAISWPPSGVDTRPIRAYAGSPLPSGATDRISNYLLVGAGGGYHPNDLDVDLQVTKALQHTATQPAGHRGVMFHNVSAWVFMLKNPQTGAYEDLCLDPTTNQPIILNLNVAGTGAASLPQLEGANLNNTGKPMQCLFWNEGESFARDWVDEFFSKFKSQGGQLDYVSMDMEDIPPYGAWGLLNIQKKCEENRAQCAVSWCEAMVQDPRWPPDDMPFSNFVYDVCSFSNPQWQQNRWIYNEWLFDRQSDIVNNVVYDTAKDYFSDVKVSDYAMYHWNDSYPVPHGLSPDYLYGDGTHVGTHQSQNMYGTMNSGSAAQYASAGFPSGFSVNPFNTFKYYVNFVRSAALSDDTPLATWISDKTYPDSLVASSDLYQEMVMHAGLTNNDYFQYFSTSGSGLQNPSNANLVDDIMAELELMTGYEDTEMLIDDIVDWDDEYIASGIQVGDYKVWRFTPKSMSGALQNDGNADGSESVIFEVDGDTITFPNAMIYTPPNAVSSAGYWVIQAPDADDPDFAFAGPMQSVNGGQFAAAWQGYQNMGQYILDAVLNVKENLANMFLSLFWE